MPCKVIQQYAESLSGHDALMMHGPMTPYLLMFPWQKEKNELWTFCINKGRNTVMSVDNKNYLDIARSRFRLYCEDKLSISYLQEEYRLTAQKISDLYEKETEVDFSKSSEKYLRDLLQRIVDIFFELAQGTVYVETLSHEMILEVIGERKGELLDSVWETATHPTFLSFDARWLGLLIDLISKSKATSGSLIRKARFIYTDYHWSKKDSEIEAELADLRAHLAEKKLEFEAAVANVKARKDEYRKWRSGLNTEQTKIAEYIQLMMYFRDIRKDAIAQLQAVMCEVGEEMLGRARIDTVHAKNVLIYEYIKGVDYLKSIRGGIESRMNGWISLVRADSSYEAELCDFDKAVAEFNSLATNDSLEVRSFKGQVANKGKIVGTVRIVIDPHGYRGFNRGDILVTSMTRPEFVPLMRQAGGVITNEGGVTCHAAIVSRELNIPCIIGTKIATRVLKDGDEVEVDAMKGVVTVLSK